MVQALVDIPFPGATIFRIDIIRSNHQHPLRRVELSNGVVLLISGPATPKYWGWLISKHSATRTEAVVLSWLSSRRRRSGLAEASTVLRDLATTAESPEDDALARFLPRFLYHFHMRDEGLYFSGEGICRRTEAWNIMVPVSGQPISTLEAPLSRNERQSVDQQLGHFLRALATVESPNGRFGFAGEVLSGSAVLSTWCQNNKDGLGPIDGNGDRTWSETYDRLIREASSERRGKRLDIPFDRVRIHFERFRGILDNIMRPRLVALDGGDDANALVIREAPTDRPREPTSSVDRLQPPDGQDLIRLTGLQDWSNVIFGDPLIASIFSRNPSADVLKGFTRSAIVDTLSKDLPRGSFEDQRHVHVRLLLYQCYWIIKGMVQRPCNSSVWESWRIQSHADSVILLQTLAKLDALPSIEMRSDHEASKAHLSRKRRRSESPSSTRLACGVEPTLPVPRQRRRCNTP